MVDTGLHVRWVVVAVVRVSGVCWYATLDPLNLAFAGQRQPSDAFRQSSGGPCSPGMAFAAQRRSLQSRDGLEMAFMAQR